LKKKNNQLQELEDELKEGNTEYQKLININEKLKTDISFLEKKLEEYEKEIDYHKGEKENYEDEIKKLQNDIENNLKEIESLKNIIEQYKEEVSNLNAELDQYENESKMMDNEIKTLKEKIIELNKIIEDLKNQISELKSKIVPEKDPCEKFCDLYKNFSKRNTMPQEIDMIVGMHLSKQEKNNQKKYNNLLEVQDRLKKRIADLTGELNNYKHCKKSCSDLVDHKIDFELNTHRTYELNNENKSQIMEDDDDDIQPNSYRNYANKENYSNNNKITRKVDLGTTTQQVGNTIITTKTTQISYKRKRGGNQ
jgi:chromosome segregation ATPase